MPIEQIEEYQLATIDSLDSQGVGKQAVVLSLHDSSPRLVFVLVKLRGWLTDWLAATAAETLCCTSPASGVSPAFAEYATVSHSLTCTRTCKGQVNSTVSQLVGLRIPEIEPRLTGSPNGRVLVSILPGHHVQPYREP